MTIIGTDWHPGFQQIASVNTDTGDCGEHGLEHARSGEGCRQLAIQGKKKVRNS
jgi:hypothetical protein